MLIYDTIPPEKASRLKVESRKQLFSEQVVNTEWQDTCKANQSFPLRKYPQIRTQKSSALVFIIFYHQYLQPTKGCFHQSSSAYLYQKLLPTIRNLQHIPKKCLRCLLQSADCHVINNCTVPKAVGLLDFEPQRFKAMLFNLF